eukprot:TRINITY_DN5029_c0_g1_i4.p1 TRINITY_DN5029_c0_g1~~TRINITY_DN5029_c0_g1_i4.p1  ORF type:complete len:567 (-),score=170.69 TRINITY_DN5029_c0_g1_i4:56-1756(-)
MLGSLTQALKLEHENDLAFINTELPKVFPVQAPGGKDRVYPSINSLLKYFDPADTQRLRHNTRATSPPTSATTPPPTTHTPTPPPQKFSTREELVESLLLTEHQLMENNYPLMGSASLPGYVETKPLAEGKSLEPNRKMLSLDCEMCLTEHGLQLARVTVVDEKLDTLYDKLVKPSQPIIDYLTKFSGVTEEVLETANVTLEDVQRELTDLIPAQCILVGHSLENDLRSLKMCHRRVLDTVVLYAHPGGGCFRYRLSKLAELFLKKTIHDGKPHCSKEDAVITMQLTQQKIDLRWQMSENPVQIETPTLPNEVHLTDVLEHLGLHSSFIDIPHYLNMFCGEAKQEIVSVHPCTNDEQAFKAAQLSISGVDDFVWCHFHGVTRAMTSPTGDITETVDSMKVGKAIAETDGYVRELFGMLPPKSLFVLISSQGHVSTVKRLLELRTQSKRNAGPPWGEAEEKHLQEVTKRCRETFATICVKDAPVVLPAAQAANAPEVALSQPAAATGSAATTPATSPEPATSAAPATAAEPEVATVALAAVPVQDTTATVPTAAVEDKPNVQEGKAE